MSAANKPSLEVLLESGDFPCDRIQISKVSGRERISELFRFEIVLACLEPRGLDADKVTGSTASLVFLADGAEVRRIHGMISEVSDLLDSETEFGTYRLIFVPRAFRMALVKTQEIFVDVSVPEILERTLTVAGLADDFDLRLIGEYQRREFVVQYAETDLAFVSRITEHLGISFFFEHTSGRDRIVFTDHKDGFHAAEGAPAVRFRPRGERKDVYRLDITTRLIPSTYIVSDYNDENPQLDLTSTCELKDGYGGGVIEWGTNFKVPEDGARFALIRAEERMVDGYSITGESGLATLSAGARFTLEDHPRLPTAPLLVFEIEHRLHQSALASGGASEPLQYTNVFRAVPASSTYRPARSTPRPRIHGVQSGIVDTAPGVDVTHAWIDDHGRYTIRVLFDTATPGERKSSLPIRMAQAHTGPNYGIHFPLRPGAEVLLAFVDGDPDRPVIVGSVPNAITRTPVFDAEPTMHRIRTASGVLVEIDDGA
jgi:type VI secretion system secreted protein VgrG